MTYMGQPYYPKWLDNLADDVTLEGAAMEGAARGAQDVHQIVVDARTHYDDQQFSFAGEFGENGFLEVYNCLIQGAPTRVVVKVGFDDAGKTNEVVVLHRPRSSVLLFSRIMGKGYAGTHLGQYFIAEDGEE